MGDYNISNSIYRLNETLKENNEILKQLCTIIEKIQPIHTINNSYENQQPLNIEAINKLVRDHTIIGNINIKDTTMTTDEGYKYWQYSILMYN